MSVYALATLITLHRGTQTRLLDTATGVGELVELGYAAYNPALRLHMITQTGRDYLLAKL